MATLRPHTALGDNLHLCLIRQIIFTSYQRKRTFKWFVGILWSYVLIKHARHIWKGTGKRKSSCGKTSCVLSGWTNRSRQYHLKINLSRSSHDLSISVIQSRQYHLKIDLSRSSLYDFSISLNRLYFLK